MKSEEVLGLSLSNTLKEYGFTPTQNLKEASIVVCLNPDVAALPLLIYSKLLGKTLIQLQSEPKVVSPFGWRESLAGFFLVRVFFGRPHSQSTQGGTSMLCVTWPQTFSPHSMGRTHEVRAPGRPSDFVFFGSNKFSWIEGEAYSLRRRVLLGDKSIDIWGHNWTQWVYAISQLAKALISAAINFQLSVSGQDFSFLSKTSRKKLRESHVGHGGAKGLIYSGRIAVVIENDLSIMTEKLFDAVGSARAIVYVGPELEDFRLSISNVFKPSPDLRSIYLAMEAAQSTLSSERSSFVGETHKLQEEKYIYRLVVIHMTKKLKELKIKAGRRT